MYGDSLRISSKIRCCNTLELPVIIVNEKDPLAFQSVNTAGLYPAGEGAGYAGGIMSAAIDGIKVAEALAKYYSK